VRIVYKSPEEIRIMREAGLIAAEILESLCAAAKPGVSTWELDQLARKGIEKHKVVSAFLGYAQPPYPAVVCTSINEVIVHGIPRKNEVLREGDIIGIDFGIFHKGYCADTARTVLIGQVGEEKRKLVATAQEALETAIAHCRVGERIGDISHAVQSYAESRGYSVVTQFVGHGTGRHMHEDPQVPNFGQPGSGKRIKSGLVIAVEPMVNAGAPEVEVLDDKWTAVTKDRSMSAHFEHTIAITDEGPWVLTRPSATPGKPQRAQSHEGTSIRQTDLSQVQGHQAQGRRPHHLQQPASQAAPGLRGSHGTYRRRRPPA
jgi:methionyl aminopeptidase